MEKNQRQKRVAAIHDISCFGRCSLTVALPILSAAGIETSVIPTAILSTHTGGFEGYTCRDLTDDILPIAAHWKSLGLRFDAVYSGYLGSLRQVGLVSEIFDLLRTPETLLVVDPVMADNGSLYASFDAGFPSEIRKLCRKADIIVPNVTEACLLLDRPYRPGPYDTAFLDGLLRGLTELGPRRAVVTGVSPDGAQMEVGAACLDVSDGSPEFVGAPFVDGFYPGTGDVFASVLVAGLLAGHRLADASRAAVGFTYRSILRTKTAGTDPRYGVNFEAGLGELSAVLKNIRDFR
jgi:pyridoxine kinase